MYSGFHQRPARNRSDGEGSKCSFVTVVVIVGSSATFSAPVVLSQIGLLSICLVPLIAVAGIVKMKMGRGSYGDSEGLDGGARASLILSGALHGITTVTAFNSQEEMARKFEKVTRGGSSTTCVSYALLTLWGWLLLVSISRSRAECTMFGMLDSFVGSREVSDTVLGRDMYSRCSCLRKA